MTLHLKMPTLDEITREVMRQGNVGDLCGPYCKRPCACWTKAAYEVRARWREIYGSKASGIKIQ